MLTNIDDDLKLDEVIKKYNISELFSDINIFRPGMKLVTMKKNSFLYSRSEHNKYIYFLLEGELQVTAISENGQQMLIRSCDEFIILGDMELLGYGNAANTIMLLTKCTFLALDVVMLREKLLNDPVFLRFLCRNLAEKINTFTQKQFHNKSITNRQKLASHIIEVSGETGFYKENLRHTAITLDISYRHLHRILSELVEDGTLVRCNKGYQIKKISQLEKYYWDNEK